MKYVICFQTIRPNKEYFELCSELKCDNYDIYIIIDDNSYVIDFNYDKDIKVIYMNNIECENAGYKSLVRWLRNKSCSKDKALYYLIKNQIQFDYVWFLEEDCFIPSKNTIKNIDAIYNCGQYDLLVKENFVFHKRQNDREWHWKYVYELCKLPPPHGKALVCALRCSNKLIKCIEKYVSINKNLFYCESIFNTICLHNNLKIRSIKELKYMTWIREYKWKYKEIRENFIYHPIKDINIQCEFRKKFK